MRTKAHNGNGRADAQGRRRGTGPYITEPQPAGATSSLALESRRQQLGAALRQIDKLLKLNKLLKEEKDLLANSLTSARQFAFHDELTDLPNRRLLQDHFDLAVAQATRQHKQVVLLFLDLDGFKDVNDANGHAIADRLLQQVGMRLKACIRGSDTACRYGGDEFVVLLPDVESRDQAIAASEKIRAQLAMPYFIDGAPLRMTASIGIATYPVDGKSFDELIQAADFAMYRNKAGTHGAALPAPPDTDLEARHRSTEHHPTEEHGLTSGQSIQTGSPATVHRTAD